MSTPEDVTRLRVLAEEYEGSMVELLKALAIVRVEANKINLFTQEDCHIADKYGMEPFWAARNNMIIEGYDIALFADRALRELAARLPELWNATGLTLCELTGGDRGEGG